ncbi:hypothetical protein FB107DRAFT_272216 [Schizophyllum commune]
MAFPFTTGSPFVSLPADLHMLVLSFLTPLDIVSVRLTCKGMVNVTRTRSVWLDALKRVCLSYAIPFVTYDFPSMTVGELEYAATMPDRFRYAGRGKKSLRYHILRPLKERRIPIRTADFGPQGWEVDELESLAIVPGGRFVLARTLDTLLLWDLHSDSNKPCLARYGLIEDAFDGRFAWKDAYMSCSDLWYDPANSKMRFVLDAYNNGLPNESEYSCGSIAYELDLASTPPQLNMLNYLWGSSTLSFAGRSGNRVIYNGGMIDKIGVWDFEHNTAAAWQDTSQMPPVATEYHVVDNDWKTRLKAYEIPPFVPVVDHRMPATTEIRLVQEVTLADFDPDILVKCRGTEYINAASANDFTVLNATIMKRVDEYTDVVTDFVHLYVHSTPGDTPIGRPMKIAQTKEIERSTAPKQNDERVTVVSQHGDPKRGEMLVHFTTIGREEEQQTVYLGPKKGRFFAKPRDWLDGGGEYDFCPATGRLCVGRVDKNMLYIYDFIPMPSQGGRP